MNPMDGLTQTVMIITLCMIACWAVSCLVF